MSREKPLSLQEFVTSLVAEEPDRVVIDFSDIFDRPPHTIEFTYASPDTAALFNIPALARKIRSQYPDWSDELLGEVATFAICHAQRQEAEQEPWILYGRLAKVARPARFMRMLTRLYAHFPHLRNFNAGMEEEKKTSEATTS